MTQNDVFSDNVTTLFSIGYTYMESSITATQSEIVELATIKLASGKTEADLVQASNIFQREFLDQQPGFIRRELVRKAPSEYVDIIHWRSQEDFNEVMKVIETSPVVQQFFSVMDFDPVQSEEAVQIYSSVSVYQAKENN